MYIFRTMGIIVALLIPCLTACFGNSDTDCKDYIAVATTDKPTTISETEFKKLVMDFQNNTEEWKYEGKLPSIITFTADWCAPCRRMAPIFDELAKTYAGKINIYKVNVDHSRNVAMAFGVQSIPTMLFARMNGLPAIQPGVMSKEQLVQAIESFLLQD